MFGSVNTRVNEKEKHNAYSFFSQILGSSLIGGGIILLKEDPNKNGTELGALGVAIGVYFIGHSIYKMFQRYNQDVFEIKDRLNIK